MTRTTGHRTVRSIVQGASSVARYRPVWHSRQSLHNEKTWFIIS